MKRVICGLLACIVLTACSAEVAGVQPFSPEDTVQALLNSGGFSETLEELDAGIAAMLFALEGDAGQYEGSVLYYSTGATSETAAVIQVKDAGQTGAVEETLRVWVDAQIEAVRDYQPAEVEKLEHAILETRGNTVLLAVAADWESAAGAVPAA